MSSVMFRVARFRPPNICCIASISDEILRLIFMAVVDSLRVSCNEPLRFNQNLNHISSSRTSLGLSHVSAAWRSVARHCSQLWLTIDLAQPRFAELCVDLSRPQQIQVFCRNIQEIKDPGESLRPEYLAALDCVFRESMRIKSLQLSDRTWESRPHFERGILPILARLEASFPTMKSCQIMMWGSRLPPNTNLDLLLKGASNSLKELSLPIGTLSLDVMCSFHLVTLKIGPELAFTGDEWRLVFGRYSNTLKHLDMPGQHIKNIAPPILLPNLSSFSMPDASQGAALSIHAPSATRLDFNDYHDHEDYDHETAGQVFARAINQRFRETAKLHPIHLRYYHDNDILCTNSDVQFRIFFSTAMDAFSSLCRHLDTRVCESITHLQFIQVSTANPDAGEEAELDYFADYHVISIHLTSVEMISLDAKSQMDFLFWWVCPGNHTLFPTVTTLKIHHLDFEDPELVDILINFMDLRAEGKQPVHLLVEGPYAYIISDMMTSINALRAKGHTVTLVDADV